MEGTLSVVDWAVVASFLLAVGIVGYSVSGKQRSTRDYFLGGRSLPWWAASLSIVATETSAVTFLAMPAAAFRGDWSVLQMVLGFVIGRVVLATLFVDVFYRRDYLTVYGFLGDRFGPVSRGAASLLFVGGRLLASGVRLYAGCLAVHVATGLSLEATIVGLGLFGTCFTLLGGIRAVVWTDVLLGFGLVVGGVTALVFLIASIPGGFPAILGQEDLGEKLRLFHAGWDPGDPGTFVAGLLGGFVLTLATHGTDQDIAQRMLTCRDARGGRFSLLGSAVLIVPVFCLFLAVGTLLHYYHELTVPTLEEAPYDPPDDPNHILPLFIVNVLPGGVAGVAMAGLLAAALSSFTSALNALASTAVGDFYRPLRDSGSERHYLLVSKAAMLVAGGALILTALAFVDSRENLFHTALKVFGYFYGALLAPFLLGILTRRGNDRTVLAGMLVSVPVVLVLQLREFVEDPAGAPGVIQRWVEGISPETHDAILGAVPDIAWPYWIVIGTATCLAVGALGRRGGADV